MTYRVFHYEGTTRRFSEDAYAFPTPDFVEVATVEAASLEDVFRLTNSIYSDWTRNPEVTLTRPGGVRSTSVGDVVVDVGGARVFGVANFGFALLAGSPVPA